MLNRHRPSPPRHATAFTLLELLLVLAVMVAVGAIAIPGIFGVLANRQLARGGDGLRVAMVQARLEAMRTGRTQIMRFEIGGSRFQVVPHYDASDVTEAGDMIGRGTAVATGGVAMPVLPGGPNAGSGAVAGTGALAGNGTDPAGPRDLLSVAGDQEQLPEMVLFEQARVQATARSSTIDRTTGGSVAPGSDAGWSQPVLFYADGTTSNAAVTLSRESVGRVVVRIRGLTGETMVSELMP